MKIIFSTFLFLVSITALGQSSFTVKGKIADKATGEWLPGITVNVKGKTSGVFSDNAGNYAIDVAAGSNTLVFNFIGYTSKEVSVQVLKNMSLDVELVADDVSLREIEVSATRRDDNITNVQMGVDKLEIKTMNKIPVLLGEKDILKTIQLLPGVQSAGEGRTGFYVRGGSDDQNMIMLDNAVVYNPSHLFGFFSTFNSDVVDDMTLYKGSMPAQYGGRLSSVLDVMTRDGNMKEYDISGGIGLISSKLTIEGPIQKEKSSFIISARRTYADALARLAGVEAVKNNTLYFYDLNAKLSYFITEKDKLTLTGYTGRDKLGVEDLVAFDWGNTFGTLKWNHIFNPKASSITTLTGNRYSYNVNINFGNEFNVKSFINEYSLNQEFNFFPNDKHTLKVGFNSVYRYQIPGDLKAGDPSKWDSSFSSFANRYSWENAIFGNENYKVNDKIELGIGLRLSTASTLGGGKFYEYDSQQNVTDTLTYNRGALVKTYFNIEPRLSVAYQLNDKSSLKAGYTRTAQNMHMLKVSNMEATPSDRWVSNNNYIKPEFADQYSIGYFRNFADNVFEFSAEFYYKDLKNQIDYMDGAADVVSTENIEPYLLFGKGRAFGMELFLKKRHGRFNGWLGYTLSRSQKKIDGINDNTWYTAIQDRRHNVSVVGIYDFNKKLSFSASWVFSSGAPITLPSAKYEVDGQLINYYEGRNLSRAAAYHRLDLGATCILKNTKKFYSELTFSLYNAYGRKNPYIYVFEQNYDDNSVSESKMIYLFSAIPSITWNFKF